MVIMTIVDDIDIDHIKDILKTLTPPSPRWQQHRSADVPASDSDDWSLHQARTRVGFVRKSITWSGNGQYDHIISSPWWWSSITIIPYVYLTLISGGLVVEVPGNQRLFNDRSSITRHLVLLWSSPWWSWSWSWSTESHRWKVAHHLLQLCATEVLIMERVGHLKKECWWTSALMYFPLHIWSCILWYVTSLRSCIWWASTRFLSAMKSQWLLSSMFTGKSKSSWSYHVGKLIIDMSPTCCAQGDHQQHQDDLHQHLHHHPPVPQGYSLPRYFAPSSPVTTVLLPTWSWYQWWGWCWWCLWWLTTGEDGDCGDDDDDGVDVAGGDGDDGENWPQQREAGFSSTWTTTVCTLFWGFHFLLMSP